MANIQTISQRIANSNRSRQTERLNQSSSTAQEQTTNLNRTHRYSNAREKFQETTYIEPEAAPVIEEPIYIPEVVEEVPAEPEPIEDKPNLALAKIDALKRELLKDTSLGGTLDGKLHVMEHRTTTSGDFYSTDGEKGESFGYHSNSVGTSKDIFGSSITLSDSDKELVENRDIEYIHMKSVGGEDVKCQKQVEQDQTQNVEKAKDLKAEVLKDIEGLSQEEQDKTMQAMKEVFEWIATDAKYEIDKNEKSKQIGIDAQSQAFIANAGRMRAASASAAINQNQSALSAAEAELAKFDK